MSKPLHRTAHERFWNKVDVRGDTDCWPWTAAKLKSGYGALGQDGDYERMAHRISWVLANGSSIPHGMLIMHDCDNPSCVNPSHLRLGTDADNMLDKVEKGRQGVYGLAKVNAQKTHCPKGHPLSGDNLRVSKDGRRCCRACKNAECLARYYAKKAVA